MDFGALPPEINSALMYAGAGAGPMMAAAATWSTLAAELSSTAASYESVVSELTGGQWMGPASTSMVSAVQPYIAWMNLTAGQAQHAATQATASAAAYEAAFAGTVPPPVVAANRALLAALVATNIVGQNTPAIAAAEAHYGEMWAQDAATMYLYAATSSTAGTLTPMTSPAATTNPGGLGAQAAAVANSATGVPQQLLSAITNLPNTLAGLASPLQSSITAAIPAPIMTIVDDINQLLAVPGVSSLLYQISVTASWNEAIMTASFPLLGHFLAGAPFGITLDPATVASDVTPVGGGIGTGTVLANSVGSAEAGMTADLGAAASVGGLSVPGAWSAATPATLASSVAPLEGSGWAVPAEEVAAGPGTIVPGMPGMAAAAGKGAGAWGGPRYGFKPTVMPKTVLV